MNAADLTPDERRDGLRALNSFSVGKYILEGRTPVPAKSLLEWAQWSVQEHKQKRVAATLLNRRQKTYVSTVFLGMDHSWDGGPPLLFETMVFGTSMDGYCERYTDWVSAERGHARIVGYARRARQIKWRRRR